MQFYIIAHIAFVGRYFLDRLLLDRTAKSLPRLGRRLFERFGRRGSAAGAEYSGRQISGIYDISFKNETVLASFC